VLAMPRRAESGGRRGAKAIYGQRQRICLARALAVLRRCSSSMSPRVPSTRHLNGRCAVAGAVEGSHGLADRRSSDDHCRDVRPCLGVRARQSKS
jgi:hypothetical protein